MFIIYNIITNNIIYKILIANMTTIRVITAEELKLDDESSKIWNRVVATTNAKSTRDSLYYRIDIDIQLTKIDKDLVIYPIKISGDNGEKFNEEDRWEHVGHYEIIIKNGRFISTVGSMDNLEKVLNILERREERRKRRKRI